MTSSRPPLTRPVRWTYRVIGVGALLLFLYGVVPRLAGLSGDFDTVLGAHKGYLVTAVGLLGITFLLAAGIYQVLTIRHLRWWRTVQVQLAGGFIGKLLPAGLGTMSLSAQYLRKSQHTTGQAVAIVAANNAVGLVGNMVLLLCLVLLGDLDLPHLERPHISGLIYAAAAVALAVAVGLLVSSHRLRDALGRGLHDILQYARSYRNHPWKLLVALVFAIGLTICYIVILDLSALSLGHQLPLTAVFVIFSVGMIASAATPTPGGLVGAEAGLAAGLVAYGLELPQAVTVALLYRFLTYWLPLVPGVIVFWRIHKIYL